MFNSIRNNFGAGVIQFKDVQESNYIVLNAKFTCNPQSAEYQAAEVLEITVPALSIARSTEAGVIARYKERGTSYGYPYIYDGGTVLKSWVKDANTLCIEKLSVFDDQTELIIYIQTLYCQRWPPARALRASIAPANAPSRRSPARRRCPSSMPSSWTRSRAARGSRSSCSRWNIAKAPSTTPSGLRTRPG